MKLGLNISITPNSVSAETNTSGSSGNTGGATASISLIRRSTLHVVPEGLVFGVDLQGFDTSGPGAGKIYDPRFHDLYYLWKFDDAYMFSAPDHLVAAHRNANIAYGPWVSHVFRTAGTYNVSCLIIEPSSGKSATANLSVVIGNPDALFSGAHTIFMSPSGSFSNAPAGSVQVTSASVSDVLINNILGQDIVPKRLVLNRGENYTCAGVGFMGLGEAIRIPTLHIIAAGDAGSRPEVACTGGLGWNDIATSGTGSDKDWIIQGINWNGTFDSTTGTGADPDMFSTWANPPNLLLFDQCNADGFGYILNNDSIVSQNVQHRVTVINDCIFKDFRDLVIGEGDKTAHAILGSYIGSDANALVDSTPNGGSPVRFGGNDRLNIIHSSEFFCRQGWSGHGNYIATQPNVRLNSEGFEGARANVQASSFEGGFSVLSMTRAESSTAAAGNFLIEKNYLVGGYQTPEILSLHFGGATVRNNVMVMPDSVDSRLPTTNDPYTFIGANNIDGNRVNADSPIRVYNNTFVNRVDASHYVGGSAPAMALVNNAGSSFSNVTIKNNIEHQTAIDTPNTSDAPLAQTDNLWAPYELGYQTGLSDFRSTTATSTAIGMIATYAPLTGSAALGDADETALLAYDDFYGNQRPQYPSRGAFEMP